MRSNLKETRGSDGTCTAECAAPHGFPEVGKTMGKVLAMYEPATNRFDFLRRSHACGYWVSRFSTTSASGQKRTFAAAIGLVR